MRDQRATEVDEARPPKLGYRDLFAHLEVPFYLNHASLSPPSQPVQQAVTAVLSGLAAHGVNAVYSCLHQRDRLKGKLAELIGARAEDVAFVQSTTSGILAAALCFPWRARDRVVLFDREFPANITPWQRAAALFDLEIALLPLEGFADGSGDGLTRLEAELRRGARLVAVSAVQFQSGLRMPLAAMGALCKAYGAELFVDAVQACGAVPVDVAAMGIDYLACGGHKWLMGLEGTGFLYVHPERVGALRPNVAGWLSHEEPFDFLIGGAGKLRYDRPIRRRADFVEAGNLSTVGYFGLEAALDLLLELGVPAIYEHVNRYLDRLEEGLSARGFTSLRAPDPAARSCILGALPPDGTSTVALQPEIARRGVSCSMPDGVLRFSPHWPNSHDEVEGVLRAIDEVLSQASKRA